MGGSFFGSATSPYLEDILRYDPDDASWEVMEQKLEDPGNCFCEQLLGKIFLQQ